MTPSQQPDDELLVHYLLGDVLPEGALDQVESGYFNNDQCFDRLLGIEDDLIDAYVLNTMPSRQRAQFEAHFLASSRRREKCEAQRAIVGFFRANVPRTPFLIAVRRFFRSQAGGVRFAIVVAGAVIAVWMGFTSTALFRAERDASALRSRVAALESVPAAAPLLATFVLTPGTLRSGGAEQARIPAGVQAAVLRLRVSGAPADASFEAELSTPESVVLWRQSRLRRRPDPAGDTVDVLLPAELLTPGDYVMTLSAVGAQGRRDLASYVFRVERN